MLIKTKIPTNKDISCFKSLRCCIYLLINVKMPTIVGILTFMSRINFVLGWVEYEKSFITLGPALFTPRWYKLEMTLNYCTTKHLRPNPSTPKNNVCNNKHREPNLRAHVLLNLLNELRKRDKMQGLHSILSLFHNKFNKFNNTGARMLDSITHDIKIA